MGERVTAPAPTSKHRPWESAQAKSYSGQGVVGSPTSLVDIFDTAFSSTVDHPPNGADYRTGEGKDIACMLSVVSSHFENSEGYINVLGGNSACLVPFL
jgi:hypothetical protein